MSEPTVEIKCDPGPTTFRIVSDAGVIETTAHEAHGLSYEQWLSFDEDIQYRLCKSALALLTSGIKGTYTGETLLGF